MALLGWAGEASANLGGLGRLGGAVGRGAGHAGAHVGGRVAGEVAARSIPDQIGRVCGIIAIVAFLLAGVFFAALFARDLYRKDLSAWVFETRVGTALIPVVILLFCYLGPGVLLWQVFFPEYGSLHWLVVATAPLLIYACLIAWLVATRWPFTGDRGRRKRVGAGLVAVALTGATAWYLAGPWPRWRLDAAIRWTVREAERGSHEEALRALDFLDQVVRENPDRSDFVDARNRAFETWLKGSNARDPSRPEFWRALAVLDRCIANGYGGRPFSERAWLHLRINEDNWALADAAEAVRLDPGNAKHWWQLGVIQDTRGHHADAIRSLREATRLDLGNAGHLVSLGWAYWDADQHEEAILTLQEAVRAESTRGGEAGADYWYHRKSLATGYAHDGRYAEAEAELRAVLAADPKDMIAYFLRGISRHRQGDYSGAIADFRTHADLGARSGLGQFQNQEGILVEAWTITTCPDTAVRNASEGIAAADRVRKQLGAKPDRMYMNMEQMIYLIQVAGATNTGRFDDARRAIEERTRYLSDPKFREERAVKVAARRAARDAGDWEKALAVSQWLEANPLPVELRNGRERSYWGRHQSGIEEAVRAGKPYFVYPVAPPPRPRP